VTTPSVFDAAAREKEVTLTTYGRKTGKPNKVTIWITTDGEKLFVRSGKGFRRDWPQNLMARGEAELRVGGQTVKVKPRHVTDPEEAFRQAVEGVRAADGRRAGDLRADTGLAAAYSR